jgi:hypothetical protein
VRRPIFSGRLATLAVALAACAERPLPTPTVVATPPHAQPESLRWAIEAALSEHNWTVFRRGPGFIEANVFSQGSAEGASIHIAYGGGTVEIECLSWHVDPQRYERWMRLLSAAINKYVAPLGVGAPPP